MQINLRKFKTALSPPGCTELDSTYTYLPINQDMTKTALLLIDCWASNPNTGFQNRARANMDDKLIPLINRMRAAGTLICHACYDEYLYGNYITPQSGDWVINLGAQQTAAQIHMELFNMGRAMLFMAGYAINNCLLQRPLGMLNFVYHTPSLQNLILIRDCTIGFESPESLEGEGNKKAIIQMVECWSLGFSTTSEEIV